VCFCSKIEFINHEKNIDLSNKNLCKYVIKKEKINLGSSDLNLSRLYFHCLYLSALNFVRLQEFKHAWIYYRSDRFFFKNCHLYEPCQLLKQGFGLKAKNYHLRNAEYQNHPNFSFFF
jgi:hypothetical protein